ncbi:MAG: hypothetical protein AMXMBFR83_19620 [Phycisphaerae bacterium]
MNAKKRSAAVLAWMMLGLVSPALGAQVWTSTFDAGPDGVVDVKDCDSTKVMIGAAAGGRLTITTKDRGNLGTTANDRAGRPLGTTLNGNNSFSALYRFNWSSLSNNTNPIYEGVGFMGSDACPTGCSATSCTPTVRLYQRQVCGALLIHRKDANTGNFMVRLGVQFGEAGLGNHFLKSASTEVNLGASASTPDYYLAIGYDGSSHVLSLGLFELNGAPLGLFSTDLDAFPGGLAPSAGNTVQTMLDSLAMTHLGWNDFVLVGGGSTPNTNVWQVDELTYFNDAAGAFNAVPNQALGACCTPAGGCLEGQSQGACSAVGGLQWNGGAGCEPPACPPPIGACCHPDGSCSQETETTCVNGIQGTWQGANTACSLTSCPQPPTGACCSNLDGSCSNGKTQYNCAGDWQGANTTCDGVQCPPPPPGACCLPNGACIEVSGPQCTLQCGTFHGAGSVCPNTNCPQDPVGACCLADGTCTQTLEWQCEGAWHGPGSTCEAAGCRPMPTLVWWSNFHKDYDGLEDVRDNNAKKVLIGPQCDGRVQIHTQSDGIPNPNTPDPSNPFEARDRGGRALGTTVTGNDSFSGLYRFRWSDLPEAQELMWEFPAFVGDRDNATQQVLGCILHHNKVGENYFVRMCSAGGEAQYYFLFQCGPSFNLGPDAESREFQLVIAYDGKTHLLSHALFDDQGALLGSDPNFSFRTWDLDTVGPTGPSQNYFDCTVPPPACTKQIKYDRTALTHLGWLEYFQPLQLDTIWQVDSLAYFSDAAGAYNAVYFGTPPDLGACCRPDGSCADDQTQLACLAVEGGWGGPGSTCATTSCTGACCRADGICADNMNGGDCQALGGTFQGLQTVCADVSCPLPECPPLFADVDDDGDVDHVDYGAFQNCFGGPFGGYVVPLCHCFDRDNGGQGDGDVDGRDLVAFEKCASGPDVPADPACANAP